MQQKKQENALYYDTQSFLLYILNSNCHQFSVKQEFSKSWKFD